MRFFTKKSPADAGLNAEYKTLSPEQKGHVDGVVDKTKEAGKQVTEQHGSAQYYGYPHASGGTAWGIDDPINIKRGVKPK